MAEGQAPQEVARQTAISLGTIYRWRKEASQTGQVVRGRPKKIPLPRIEYLLHEFVRRDFSASFPQHELWTWGKVKSELRVVGISRQTIMRLLRKMNIFPADAPTDLLGPFSTEERLTTHVKFLLERLKWERPSWLPRETVPRVEPILWRFWSSRRELLFGFSSEAADPAQTNLILCLCKTIHREREEVQIRMITSQ